MFIRTVCSTLLGCALLATSLPTHAADRGPSSPEERKKALEFTHSWQSEPLGPHAKDQFGWVLKWFADVPGQTVYASMILDKSPKGDKTEGASIFGGAFMGQAALVLENPRQEERPSGRVSGRRRRRAQCPCGFARVQPERR